MFRPKPNRLLLAATLSMGLGIGGFGTCFADALGVTSAPPARLLSIKPATTWVGVARVHLEIEDLTQAGDFVEGTYRIRVPLSPTNDDTGRIRLHVPPGPVAWDLAEATMVGSAVSETGETNQVVARIQPNGVVRIDVKMPARTLRFKSRYTTASR